MSCACGQGDNEVNGQSDNEVQVEAAEMISSSTCLCSTAREIFLLQIVCNKSCCDIVCSTMLDWIEWMSDRHRREKRDAHHSRMSRFAAKPPQCIVADCTHKSVNSAAWLKFWSRHWSLVIVCLTPQWHYIQYINVRVHAAWLVRPGVILSLKQTSCLRAVSWLRTYVARCVTMWGHVTSNERFLLLSLVGPLSGHLLPVAPSLDLPLR